jgi:hypothetical protein
MKFLASHTLSKGETLTTSQARDEFRSPAAWFLSMRKGGERDRAQRSRAPLCHTTLAIAKVAFIRCG